MENDELMHFGIKGMRWGVRRNRSTSGSSSRKKGSREGWSDEAKRADDLRKKGSKSMTDRELNEYNKRTALEKKFDDANKKPSKLEGSKKVLDASSNFVNQAKNLDRAIPKKTTRNKIDLSKMSDQELRDKINRANLERQYNDLYNPAKVSKGRERVSAALDIGGSVLAVGASALGIAVAIKELSKP